MMRSLIFFILHIKNKLFLRKVKIKGLTVIFAFPKCKINLGVGGGDKLLFYKQYVRSMAENNYCSKIWR